MDSGMPDRITAQRSKRYRDGKRRGYRFVGRASFNDAHSASNSMTRAIADLMIAACSLRLLVSVATVQQAGTGPAGG